MRTRSQTLFHFTRSVDVLKSILRNGFWPRYSLEDVRWQAVTDTDMKFAAFPMVCFCDIPLSRIEEHVSFYGNYGIGMTRDWGQRNGLNPLLYLAGENSISNLLLKLGELARRQQQPDSSESGALLAHAVRFTKPVTGQVRLGADLYEKDFYQESEWRYVPLGVHFPPLLREEQCQGDLLASANAATQEHAMLRFELNDVRYLFVQYEHEIPDLIKFVQIAFDDQSVADTRLLMSRVTSIETLRSDW